MTIEGRPQTAHRARGLGRADVAMNSHAISESVFDAPVQAIQPTPRPNLSQSTGRKAFPPPFW